MTSTLHWGNRNKLIFSLLLGIQISGTIAEASYVDGRVLPGGISRGFFVFGSASGIDEAFDENGNSEKVAAPYNLNLDSKSLSTAFPDFQNLVDTLNGFGKTLDTSKLGTGDAISENPAYPKLGDALSAGQLDVQIEASRTQYMFGYFRGVTDQLSLGFVVPLIHQKVDVTTSLSGTNSASEIYQYFQGSGAQGSLQDMETVLKMLAQADPESLQTLLKSAGYNRLDDWEDTGLGDIIAGGRYNYLDRGEGKLHRIGTAQAGVTVPTGRVYDPAEITAIDMGQGAWDASVGNIFNVSFIDGLYFGNSVNYTYRFSASRIERVPVSEDDILPDASTEERLDYKMGDKFWTTLGARYYFTPSVAIESGYEWYWKFQDQYSGRDPQKNYSLLSKDTDVHLQTVSFGAFYDTIGLFKKGSFPVPVEIFLRYYMPVAGKNTIKTPFGALEFAMYF